MEERISHREWDMGGRLNHRKSLTRVALHRLLGREEEHCQVVISDLTAPDACPVFRYKYCNGRTPIRGDCVLLCQRIPRLDSLVSSLQMYDVQVY